MKSFSTPPTKSHMLLRRVRAFYEGPLLPVFHPPPPPQLPSNLIKIIFRLKTEGKIINLMKLPARQTLITFVNGKNSLTKRISTFPGTIVDSSIIFVSARRILDFDFVFFNLLMIFLLVYTFILGLLDLVQRFN